MIKDTPDHVPDVERSPNLIEVDFPAKWNIRKTKEIMNLESFS
jgi:hypothetical protein